MMPLLLAHEHHHDTRLALIAVAYLATWFLTLSVCLAARGTESFRGAACCAALILIAGASEAAYHVLSPWLRDLAKASGIYLNRHSLQLWSTAAALWMASLAAIAFASLRRHQFNRVHVACLIALLLMVMAALHAVSFHSIDALFGIKIVGWLDFRAAIEIVLLAVVNTLMVAQHLSLRADRVLNVPYATAKAAIGGTMP
jgi:hypothetical protein